MAPPIKTTMMAVSTRDAATDLRWPSVLAMVSAAGLLLVAFADNLARQTVAVVAGFQVDFPFYFGIFLIAVPSGVRLLSRAASFNERIVLLIMVGLGLYLVKVLHDPVMFTFFDEFLHVRTAEDIVRSGRLFVVNGMLPVSPSFPGLEILTAALISTTGMSTFVAGTVLLGIAKVLLVLALFLFYTRLGASARIASIGTLIYMANPNFLFFTSQFAYESLALPLACFALYVVARRQSGVDSRSVAWILVGLAIAATVITHHVTAIALFAFLALWSLVAIVMRWRSPREKEAPLMPALFAGGATYLWLIAVAGIVVGYLGPAIQTAATQVAQLFRGGSARELFSASGAPRLPTWEQALAYTAIGFALAGVAWGLWRLRRTGNLSPPIVALGLGALAYPASLAARLTEQGGALSERASAFVFVAVGLVVAAGLENRRWAPYNLSEPLPATSLDAAASPSSTRRLLLPAAVLAVIMLGGVALSFPVWARVPGSYLVSADTRSIEPQGILAAQWTLSHLGRDNRFLVDRTNRLLVGAFGGQHPVNASFDQVRVRTAFFSLRLGDEEIKVMADGRISYVLIDRRLSNSLPIVGHYYEKGEVATGRHTVPISPVALAKFDNVPLVSRSFDSGDIQLYDVRRLIDESTQQR